MTLFIKGIQGTGKIPDLKKKLESMAILEERIEEIAMYFLFGSDACQILLNNGKEKFLEWTKDNTDFDVFKFSDITNPKSLLDAFSGWGDYQVITQDLYIKLSQ